MGNHLRMGLSGICLAAVTACSTIGKTEPPAPPPPLAPAPPVAAVEGPCQADPYQVYFSSDETLMDGVAQAVIQSIADEAKRCEPTAIEVTGHSDSIGSDAVNLRVSQQRADSVLDALLKQDLDVERIAIVAAGERGAVTEDDLLVPMNRKVEVQLVD